MAVKINKNLFDEIIAICDDGELSEVKENIYSCGYGELQLFKKKIDGELKFLAISFLYNSFSFIIDGEGFIGIETDEGTYSMEGDGVQKLLEDTIKLQLQWIKFTQGRENNNSTGGEDNAKSNVMNFLLGKR